MTCYCDGTAHPHRADYCGQTAAHDPNTTVERIRERARRDGGAYVVNPEAIGDPSQTPIVQGPVTGCPAHSDNWLYSAVRNNRRLEGLPPQDCTCDETGA